MDVETDALLYSSSPVAATDKTRQRLRTFYHALLWNTCAKGANAIDGISILVRPDKT
jgi:hypothetical protein